MSHEDDLAELLARRPAPVGELAQRLIDFLAAARPDLSAKVGKGWGSVNYRHAKAGFVCAVFPMLDHVSLVFEHGRMLSSPLLEGDTKQVRWIRLLPGNPIPEDEIGILLAEAIALRA